MYVVVGKLWAFFVCTQNLIMSKKKEARGGQMNRAMVMVVLEGYFVHYTKYSMSMCVFVCINFLWGLNLGGILGRSGLRNDGNCMSH